MANTPIWPGSSSFFPGDTPFGFYDNDTDFQTDADRVAIFVARRLGYPLVDVELQDINFYAAFEEAITTYGNEVYAYQVAQNYLSLEGASTGSNLNNTLVRPNLGTIVRISEQYGVEAGAGGNVTWRTGSLNLTRYVQKYDLNQWAVSQSIEAGDLEIKRVFYEALPPIVRYFDPYAGTGTDVQGLLQAFGFGSYSPGINFLLMPINFDLQKIQAIELNDQVRKSNYSYKILHFEYILKSDRNNPIVSGSMGQGKITNVSNTPYDNPTYSYINSIGRQWIFEYTLALCKEMLGYVRGKYSTIPIPNSEVTLNHGDLISAATSEKTALIERLRAYLDETSRSKLLEKRAQESENLQKELSNVPYTIYIG